ncbi:glycosyltransferase 25 family member isoform X2 [Anthonomus grandis grandis]|uniref:glycosyltransferase 25 family member isoform X2 n=1 Tax=Anthonomus grandis grandis TaxID=2921223 RepID=UPI002165FC1F|nr:glycosyltransferase 25 family member isoform X2 [Anthonomus grandis grandis]
MKVIAYEILSLLCVTLIGSAMNVELKKPTILVSVLVRNKGHILPYFLSNLERLDYPKDRISLWIRSDHNSDNSIEILKFWITSIKDQYHAVFTEFEEGERKYPEDGVAHWTDQRFNHLMNMRENSLNFARNIWADYYFSIDSDVILTNPNVLNYLISKNVLVAAPLLNSAGLYSNFWSGMTEDFYYKRTEAYKPILNRENVSCYSVPMVHSCVLVDLRMQDSDFLTYLPSNIPNYIGPNDDIIVFALSALRRNISLHICNEDFFGYISQPLEENDDLSYDYQHLLNIKMLELNRGFSLYLSEKFTKYVTIPQKDSLVFDNIFVINLKRRPDRRERMTKCFDELGLDVEFVDAVDGKVLNESFLQHIKFMPDFKDPYHQRPMKLGEIGCFLSHYQIWKKIIDNNYQTSLILEDDVRFEPFFRQKVERVMSEASKVQNWDLVYFGRKRLRDQEEPWVEGAKYLVEAGYSYWTLGYALSLSGAQKLLDAKPLTKLVPVDEYLPILFDKHPRENWKGYYPKRDLVALSADPLLIYPTHYTGEEGYISDTEDSVVIPEEIIVREDL